VLDDGTNEQWYGDSGVMKRGPFVVEDHGVGPLITERGNLVVFSMERSKLRFILTDFGCRQVIAQIGDCLVRVNYVGI